MYQWKNAPSHATLADAISADAQGLFKPSKGEGIAAGYTRQSQWLGLLPPATSNQQSLLYLTVYPSYLDNIQLFYQNSLGEWQQRFAGDTLPFVLRELPDNRFVFSIDTHSLAPNTPLYLRLQTTSTSLLLVEWVEPKAYIHQSQLGFWLLGLELGVLLTMIVAQLISGLWRQEALFRAYLLYLVVLFATLVSHHGLLAWLFGDWLSAWFTHHATSITTLAHNLSVLLFYRSVLTINKNSAPWLNGAMWLMFALIDLGFVSVLFNFYVDVIALVLLVSMLVWLGLFQRTWVLMRQESISEKRREQQVLMLAMLFVYGGNVLLIGSVLGWLPAAGWQIYAVNLTFMVLVLSFQWIISRRVAQMLAAKQAAEMQMTKSQLRLEQAIEAKEEQGRLLDMLNHELKNPLAVIRMALARPAMTDKVKGFANQAIQDMNAILERCSYSDQFEHHRLNPVKQRLELKQQLSQWLQPYPAQRLHLTLPEASIWLFSDAEWLRVIVTNLLDNALKYGDKTQQVNISLKMDKPINGEHAWLLSVCNSPSSLGLPDAQRLFSKYYRADKARSLQGTGLGLYIVKTLVDGLGYKLNYEANEHKLCFTLIMVPYES